MKEKYLQKYKSWLKEFSSTETETMAGLARIGQLVGAGLV